MYDLFKTDEELQQKIRINLQRPIFEYLQKRGPKTSSSTSEKECEPAAPATLPVRQPVYIAAEEFGLLDYAETAEEAIKNANASINRMAELVEEIGVETNARTAEVEAISAPNVPAKEKKSVVNRFADFLKAKARDLKREAAIARQNFQIFANALIMVIGIEREEGDSERYKKDVGEFLSAAETLLCRIPESRNSTTQFREAVQNLPRITIQFNQAKKLLIDALDECLQMLDETERGIYKITGEA